MITTDVRSELLRLLNELPPSRQAEVLDFARFLRRQAVGAQAEVEAPVAPMSLRALPAATLVGLSEVVSLGGDAVADAEALYDGDDRA